MNILFVCTGNTCRSSMAEGIFKELLKNIDENIHVSSAGISVYEGERANEKAIESLSKKNIDISSHKARQLTKEIIDESDLILTMTTNHKEIINYSVPEAKQKVYTLKEYAHLISDEKINGNNLDVADPYGMDYNVYELSMYEIEVELKKIINNIIKMNIRGGKN